MQEGSEGKPERKGLREFPGDPVVRTFTTGRERSILGQGTKIPHAMLLLLLSRFSRVQLCATP